MEYNREKELKDELILEKWEELEELSINRNSSQKDIEEAGRLLLSISKELQD